MKSSKNRDRAVPKNELLIETVKALIEVYKSAFGSEWKEMFRETIGIDLG